MHVVVYSLSFHVVLNDVVIAVFSFSVFHSIDYRKSEVADNEATVFSIFYNNTLFLFLLILVFYMLRSFNPYV